MDGRLSPPRYGRSCAGEAALAEPPPRAPEAGDHPIARLLRGEPAEIEVLTSSMRPLIVPGTRVLVEPICTAATPRVGEVLLLAGTDGWMRVHRCVARTADRVITRGDNAPASDPPWPGVRILGRVIGTVDGRSVRRLGWPLPAGFCGGAPWVQAARWTRLAVRGVGAVRRAIEQRGAG